VSVRRAVAQFAAGGLVAMAAVALIGSLLLREEGDTEATRDAKILTTLAGRGIVEREITPAVRRGDPEALAELNRVVRRDVLTGGVVRVKIWDDTGRIIYSDEPRLIGARYGLDPDEEGILDVGGVEAELSDLSRPENRFERGSGDLLEVYMPLQPASGGPVLFETYRPTTAVNASAARLSRQFAVPLIVGVLLLGILQIPLAWSMARRLREGQIQRERLLRKALAASDAERRRIAGSLHDGVVQDLAGVSYSLSATAGDQPATAAGALRDAANQVRNCIRRLRSALVDIYPPDLQRVGLEGSLQDLASALREQGVETTLDVSGDIEIDPDTEVVVFRAAQEALRNVSKHARATRADVRVARENGKVVLEVRDDGRGFLTGNGSDESGEVDAEQVGQREDGHLGLVMLRDLAEDAGGTLSLRSSPGSGATMRLEVPA
jgi:two-component system, NarL family, sensor kinase